MPTATAIATRPTDFKNKQVTMELVPALPEDFKIFAGWTEKGSKIIKLRVGLIYWMYSMVTNKMEETPFILNYNTDLKELNEYQKLGMIYIAKNPFN